MEAHRALQRASTCSVGRLDPIQTQLAAHDARGAIETTSGRLGSPLLGLGRLFLSDGRAKRLRRHLLHAGPVGGL